jgi:hypothetical protein
MLAHMIRARGGVTVETACGKRGKITGSLGGRLMARGSPKTGPLACVKENAFGAQPERCVHCERHWARGL